MTKRALMFAGLLAISGAAAAQDSPHSFTWSAWATTDYVFRGVSQSDENFTLQGAFDYAHESGLYAGIWASGVDFGSEGPDAEVDTYVGFGFPIGESFKGDIQVLRYNYVGGSNGSDFAYNEVIGKLTYADFITGTIGWSNDVFATDETGIYYGLSAKHGWESGTSVFGGVGYYDLDDIYEGADGYIDWNLGVAQTFGPAEVSLTYFDTDSDGSDLFGDLAGNRVVLAAKIAF
jgi:uncharacterized protein (TIGR02001 family)